MYVHSIIVFNNKHDEIYLDLFVCNLLILYHISHCWGQIGISFLVLGRAKSVERKCQNRISWGNSELTGAQWVPFRAVLAYVCPKRPNMGQIGPRDIGVDLVFGADLALFILQCMHSYSLVYTQLHSFLSYFLTVS